MLWGLWSGFTDAWNDTVHTAIANGSTHILGFNEPDLWYESNIAPADAAAGYMQWMQPYAGMIKIGGPAITDGGLTWLAQFYGNCTACTIDFQPAHWYDNSYSLWWFKYFTEQVHSVSGNRSVWLTEFAGWGDYSQQVEFLENVTPWLDATDWVGGYAYFAVFNQSLIDQPTNGDAVLSEVGLAFNSYFNATVPSSMA